MNARIALLGIVLCLGRAPADVRPADLLAAAVQPSDLARITGGDAWWPLPPESFVGLPQPGGPEMFRVVQSYQQSLIAGQPRLECVLGVYRTEAVARQAWASLLAKVDGERIDGPAIGDVAVWHSGGYDVEPALSLRFRRGRVAARVTMLGGEPNAEFLAAVGRVEVQRIDHLLAGKLRARPLPIRMRRLLPPESATHGIGPLLHSVRMPLEAWASVDNLGADPAGALATLQSLGTEELAHRRYRIAGREQLLELTLFPMRDSAAARTWLAEFQNAIKPEERLEPGATGADAAMAVFEDGTYELQFAKGRYAVDILAWPPFSDDSEGLEAAVRKMGEIWYGLLPEE